MNLDDYRLAVRAMPCPYCGSQPSQWCMRVKDGVAYDLVDYVHDDRGLAYELATRREPAVLPHAVLPNAPTDVPSTADALMQIIDMLWAETSASTVRLLERDNPEITAACRAIHQMLNHHG